MNASPGKAPLTPLHELELRSALRQKVGRSELTPEQSDALIAQVESDINQGILQRAAVSWPDIFKTAEALSAAHGVSTICRSLDTLHVALAIEMGATEFCTFDTRQSRMAQAAGLTVISGQPPP